MYALDKAINTRLRGGTALIALLAAGTASVFHPLASQGAAYPYVVFSESVGTELNSSPRRARDVSYDIKAVSDDYDEAALIDVQIDALIHDCDLNPDGWGNYTSRRMTSIDYDEQIGGDTVYHVGGRYMVRIAT